MVLLYVPSVYPEPSVCFEPSKWSGRVELCYVVLTPNNTTRCNLSVVIQYLGASLRSRVSSENPFDMNSGAQEYKITNSYTCA